MSHKPVVIKLHLSPEVYADLATLVEACNAASKRNDGFTSHGGALTVPTLLTMLAQDAAMTVSRPGSWEGANMQQVLDSHGYSSF